MYEYPIRPNELYHYGIPKRSGRYPYGSGERPYQDRESVGKRLLRKAAGSGLARGIFKLQKATGQISQKQYKRMVKESKEIQKKEHYSATPKLTKSDAKKIATLAATTYVAYKGVKLYQQYIRGKQNAAFMQELVGVYPYPGYLFDMFD